MICSCVGSYASRQCWQRRRARRCETIALIDVARARPEAPAVAVGLVNMTAAVAILVVTPLVGLTFSLPGDGRVGFLAVGALWALAAVSVRRNGR
jgi:hypothetical protein